MQAAVSEMPEKEEEAPCDEEIVDLKKPLLAMVEAAKRHLVLRGPENSQVSLTVSRPPQVWTWQS